MRVKTPMIALALLLLFCAAPALAIFGPPTKTFKGKVNFIQQSNFTVLITETQVVRILVPGDKIVPAEVQLGVEVEVKAVQGNDGFWYLDEFKKIQLTPNSPE